MPFQHEVCVRIFASLLPCFPRFLIHHLVKCSGVLAVFIKQGSHDWWVFKHVTTLLALVMSSSVCTRPMRRCCDVELASYKLPLFGVSSLVSLGSHNARSV